MRVPPWQGAAWLLATSTLLTAVVSGSDEPFPGEPARAGNRELFRRRVYPTLQSKCFNCHGDGEDLGGELDLRSREAMLRGGKGGPALVPDDPRASLVYQAVRRNDERRMPPKDYERLNAEEIAALKAWIEGGALWSKEEEKK
jgi:hypothetical protein